MSKLLLSLFLVLAVTLVGCGDEEVDEQMPVNGEPPEVEHDEEAADPGMVEIEPELPRPMFVGTPVPAEVDHLEPPREEAGERPPLLAPEGTENVALGKPVTSSDPFPIIGELEMITNGVKDGSDGNFVELGPFEQHVTIDLEDMYEIYGIYVWHYHQEARIYFDVVVKTADDPDFTENVNILFNNDLDNNHGLGAGEDLRYIETFEGKLIDAKGVQGRYVRLYSNGNNVNDLNHYIEVEVYGKPVQ